MVLAIMDVDLKKENEKNIKEREIFQHLLKIIFVG